MSVSQSEIERAFDNDPALRMRLHPEEFVGYRHYAQLLARLTSRWENVPLTSVHVLDIRVQILQAMLADEHDIRGLDMFRLQRTYYAHLRSATLRLAQQTLHMYLDDQFEDAFMRETLRPDHYRRFCDGGIRCEDVLREDPKIFIPGIAGLGRS